MLQQFDSEPEFEKFEEPFREEIELKEPFLEKIKRLPEELLPLMREQGKKIALALIALIVLGFLYWYFFAGVFSLELTVENTEGSIIDSVSGQLLAEDGSTIKPFYGGVIKASLRPGNYQLRIDSNPFYRTGTFSFTVNSDGSLAPATIILERNYDITVTFFDFPQSLSAGEERSFEIARYINNGNRNIKIQPELIDSKFKDLFESIEFVPSIPVLPPGQEVPLTVNLKVKPGIRVKNKEEGDAMEGLLAIKFLKKENPVNQEISFHLFPAPKLSVSPKPISLRKVSAGSLVTKTLKIENKSSFAVSEISVRVEIDSAPENIPSKVLGWISWRECPESADCHLSLGALEEKTLELRISLPATARNDSVKGSIYVETAGFQQKIALSFEVKEAQVELEATLSRKSVTLHKIDAAFPEITAQLKFSNGGGIKLEGVNAEIEDCTQDFARIPRQGDFPIALEPEEEREFEVIYTAPVTAEPEIHYCKLKIFYDDPFTGERIEAESISFNITVSE